MVLLRTGMVRREICVECTSTSKALENKSVGDRPFSSLGKQILVVRWGIEAR